MIAILLLIDTILRLYMIVIIASVVMSWLLNFNVVNYYNPVVQKIWDVLQALTQPVLRPLQRFTVIGGLDLSPLVVILAIVFLRDFIRHDLMALVV